MMVINYSTAIIAISTTNDTKGVINYSKAITAISTTNDTKGVFQ